MARKADIVSFLEKRDADDRAVGVIAKFRSMNPHLEGAGFYAELANTAKAGATKEQLLDMCRKEGKNRGSILAARDVVHFLQTGKPLFPEDYLGLAKWLIMESDKERQERVKATAELGKHEHEIDARQKTDALRRKREELARELGIDPAKLEQLAASPSGG